MTPSRSAPPPRPYAEFSLQFVIARSTTAGVSARARLDALEGSLAALTRRWHSGPLSPARDVRLSPDTLDAMMRWVEGQEAEGEAMARLGVYHSGAVADPTVPSGWVRVYLGTERPAPDGLRAQQN